jgi:hypothetical protein
MMLKTLYKRDGISTLSGFFRMSPQANYTFITYTEILLTQPSSLNFGTASKYSLGY